MCRILACSARNEPIDPKDVDPYWRSLYMDGSNVHEDDGERATAEDLLNESVLNFKQRANDIQMKRLAAYLRKETHPEFNDYETPPSPPQKGRPPKAKGSRFKSFFEKGFFGSKKKEKESDTNEPLRMSKEVPNFVRDHHLPDRARDFVTGYRNVRGDGHCGYRAISWWHFSDENRYDEIRWELQMEMQVHRAYWMDYLGRDYEKIWDTLNYHVPGGCPREYWFSGLEMFPLAATRFQKVIVLLCRRQSVTHLPLRCDNAQNADWENEEEPLVPPLPEIWYIGYLDTPRSEHFIVLDYQRDAPLPPIHLAWRHLCHRNVRPWSRMINTWS